MEHQAEKAKLRLHLCMAAIGGCFGGYAVLRFGRLASAATVNLIEARAALGAWQEVFLRFGVVVLYVLALGLTSCLPRLSKCDLRFCSILLDGTAALLLSFLPETGKETGAALSLFTMGFQWSVFADRQGYPCSTTFSTNNLRQFIDAAVQVYFFHETESRPRMQIYGKTLLAFHAGVLAVSFLWVWGGGRSSILLTLPLAAAALLCLRRVRTAANIIVSYEKNRPV